MSCQVPEGPGVVSTLKKRVLMVVRDFRNASPASHFPGVLCRSGASPDAGIGPCAPPTSQSRRVCSRTGAKERAHPMLKDHLLVLCTCPGNTVAAEISTALIEQGLAACVNRVSGIKSWYRWEGR